MARRAVPEDQHPDVAFARAESDRIPLICMGRGRFAYPQPAGMAPQDDSPPVPCMIARPLAARCVFALAELLLLVMVDGSGADDQASPKPGPPKTGFGNVYCGPRCVQRVLR